MNPVINVHCRTESFLAKGKSGSRQKDEGNGLNSAIIFEELSKAAPDDAVLSVDGGNNTYSFGRYFKCKGTQKVILSGYLGSIGFGLPAGMGGLGSGWRAKKDYCCLW